MNVAAHDAIARQQRAERQKQPHYITEHNAGVIESKRRRETGYTVTIYRATEAGLDPAGGEFVTVCEEHSTLCNHATLTLARDHASAPAGWCEHCRDQVYGRPPGPGGHDLASYDEVEDAMQSDHEYFDRDGELVTEQGSVVSWSAMLGCITCGANLDTSTEREFGQCYTCENKAVREAVERGDVVEVATISNRDAIERNRNKRHTIDGLPCLVCGAPIAATGAEKYVHLTGGGAYITTESAAHLFNPAGDMGAYPIGRHCYVMNRSILDRLIKR